MALLKDQAINESVEKFDSVYYNATSEEWAIASGDNLPEGVYQGGNLVVTSGSTLTTDSSISIDTVFKPEAIQDYEGLLSINSEAIADDSNPTYRLTNMADLSYIKPEYLKSVALGTDRMVVVYKEIGAGTLIALVVAVEAETISFIRSFTLAVEAYSDFAIKSVDSSKFIIAYADTSNNIVLAGYDIDSFSTELKITSTISAGSGFSVPKDLEIFNSGSSFILTDKTADTLALVGFNFTSEVMLVLDISSSPYVDYKEGSILVRTISDTELLISFSRTNIPASYVKKLVPDTAGNNVNWDTTGVVQNTAIAQYDNDKSRLYKVSSTDVCVLYVISNGTSYDIKAAMLKVGTMTFSTQYLVLASNVYYTILPKLDPSDTNTVVVTYLLSTGQIVGTKYQNINVDFNDTTWSFSNIQLELPQDLLGISIEEVSQDLFLAISSSVDPQPSYVQSQGFFISSTVFETAALLVNLKGSCTSDILINEPNYYKEVEDRLLTQYKKLS